MKAAERGDQRTNSPRLESKAKGRAAKVLAGKRTTGNRPHRPALSALLKTFSAASSGCIVTPQEQTWYGRLTTQEDYAVLLAWARRCREQGRLQPLPMELEHLRFERWAGEEEGEPFQPVVQDPADIVLLTAADTEVLTWSAAVPRLPEGFPSVRALNLDRLRDRRVFDAYLDDVLQDSRVLVVRVLGGLGYWREQLEAIHLLARAHGIALVCLPGDAQPDPDLAALCTVPLPAADRTWHYFTQGGVSNSVAVLRYLSDALLGTGRAGPGHVARRLLAT